MKTIKIGIIGAGRIGRVHAENIAKFVPEMEIKTIADPYMSEETVFAASADPQHCQGRGCDPE